MLREVLLYDESNYIEERLHIPFVLHADVRQDPVADVFLQGVKLRMGLAVSPGRPVALDHVAKTHNRLQLQPFLITLLEDEQQVGQ